MIMKSTKLPFSVTVTTRPSVSHADASCEVVRAGLRPLEESETRLVTLRKLLKEGENSGFEDYSYQSFIRELDNEGR